ncbi:type II CRISPR RNA-guided endonuclease Cas9 [Lactiplantibacillus plajomi]|uniref:CRISPR-associated endonuclease Cas9 n=1 Tax=Lactiplantibacillus plajomi TaxID=1457217 RepID=A0ABV6K669_9LACO|nr:type II CRISPR RNA-guided endonuclease Cas9 [Lactiplantibacillus plajomi]
MKKKYAVGLDIGTSSVGWTVTDLNGRLMRVKGKVAIGARLFKEGEAAADRRGFRTTRRRLNRVKWRLRLLREIFDQPISAVDPGFFTRRKYSNISPRDPQNKGLEKTLFNDRTDHDFYHDYPTIYHLRQALMTEHRKFDVRELYLAIHHIVKYRGNFLRSGSASEYRSVPLEIGPKLKTINQLLNEIDPELNLELILDEASVAEQKRVLLAKDVNGSDRKKQLIGLLYQANTADKKLKKRQKAVVTELANALVDFKTKVDVLTLTDVDQEVKKEWAFEMGNSQDSLPTIEGEMSSQASELIETVIALYNGVNLARLIPEGMSFSQSMIARYNQHATDLELLKKYIDTQDDVERRHALRETYDQYISGKDKTQAGFLDRLKKLLKPDLKKNQLADQIQAEIDLGTYMPKLRTSQNGSIPYQVHQNELDRIIANQKQYYPWLGTENPNVKRRGKFPYKLDELVGFRVPYYTGPLITTKDQQATSNAKFAWMVRKGAGEITPWNFDDKVDREQSAVEFIKRLTTTDTYLIGEDVLPQQSLLYQRFMVLNELNNVKVDGDVLPPKLKQSIFEQLFMKKRTVSIKDLQNYLRATGQYDESPEITGLADLKKFNSALTTYNDLIKILPEALADQTKRADIEKIILWSTAFEDTAIFKTALERIDWLTAEQRHRLSQIRYRGWGRLSQKLLTELKDDSGRSIIQSLWDTPNNFIWLVNREEIKQQIQTANAADITNTGYSQVIDEFYTSPQNKKAIRQVMRVLEDIKQAMGGQEPERIFIEFARGGGKAGQRTVSRSRQIETIYENLAKEIVDENVKDELKTKIKDKAAFTEKLTLYFLQNGRDLYSNQPININDLDKVDYHVDHILPQSFIKDDSLDNKVLTTLDNNETKGDQFPLAAFGEQYKYYWEKLKSFGLITQRKLNHLEMKPGDIDKYASGFVNRQLVETRQVIKLVAGLLANQYPDTTIVSVKAGLTHQFRQTFNFPKNRDINDYHHAFDAYLTAFLGTYLMKRYPSMERLFVYGKFSKSKLKLRSFNFMKPLENKDVIYAPGTDDVAWHKHNDLQMLAKIYDFKRILVTRAAYENHGALFNQTIYKAGRKDAVPKKQKLTTELYGGYSGVTTSYMAIVKVSTKDSFEFQVVKVAAWKLETIRQLRERGLTEKQAVAEVVKPLVKIGKKKKSSETKSGFEVVLPHVKINQVFKDAIKGNAHRFALTSDQYYLNLQQLYLPLKVQRVFKKYQKQADEKMTVVFDETIKQINRYFTLYDINQYRKKLAAGRGKFLQLPPYTRVEDKKTTVGKYDVLVDIFNGIHANAARKDLKIIGLSTPLGLLQRSSGITLTADAEIIYQSPTGLFERVVRLRDL